MPPNFAQARRVIPPSDSHIADLYSGADLADAYAVVLPPEASRDIEALGRCVLMTQAPWVGGLMRLRDGIMAGFGVKTSAELRRSSRHGDYDRIGIFRIHSIEGNEMVVGQEDSHLDFHVGVLRRPFEGGVGDEIVISTVVHCHNLLGRAYLAVILPFHRMVVRSMLQRTAAAGWPISLRPGHAVPVRPMESGI